MAKKTKASAEAAPAQKAAAPENIQSTSIRLAELMKKYPAGIEKALVQKGENLVGVFTDANFSTRGFADLNKQKIDVLAKAIEDISGGVLILRSSTVGLQFHNNKILPFVTPHGTVPPGQVIFSLNWKDVAAFKNWRNGEGDEISQDSINYAVYFITLEISKLV